jgi:hypothetical protein
MVIFMGGGVMYDRSNLIATIGALALLLLLPLWILADYSGSHAAISFRALQLSLGLGGIVALVCFWISPSAIISLSLCYFAMWPLWWKVLDSIACRGCDPLGESSELRNVVQSSHLYFRADYLMPWHQAWYTDIVFKVLVWLGIFLMAVVRAFIGTRR